MRIRSGFGAFPIPREAQPTIPTLRAAEVLRKSRLLMDTGEAFSE
jgi:hypothetical protein